MSGKVGNLLAKLIERINNIIIQKNDKGLRGIYSEYDNIIFYSFLILPVIFMIYLVFYFFYLIIGEPFILFHHDTNPPLFKLFVFIIIFLWMFVIFNSFNKYTFNKFICPHCLKAIFFEEIRFDCPFCHKEYFKTTGNNDGEIMSKLKHALLNKCLKCDGMIKYLQCPKCGKIIDLSEPYNEKELEKKRYE